MKFIVDYLPYYGELCPLRRHCYTSLDPNKCPVYWTKDKVCSVINPHQCEHLIEVEYESMILKGEQ